MPCKSPWLCTITDMASARQGLQCLYFNLARHRLELFQLYLTKDKYSNSLPFVPIPPTLLPLKNPLVGNLSIWLHHSSRLDLAPIYYGNI